MEKVSPLSPGHCAEAHQTQAWSHLRAGEAAAQRPSITPYLSIHKKNETSVDDSWKVVGSPPSRRGSMSASASQLQQSPPRSPTPCVKVNLRSLRRASLPLPETWASFGGLQWEGSSFFDEPPSPAAADLPTDSLTSCISNSVLSVPMLPSVPLEPVYRQHRSYSFSVGQDPSLFGYDDYVDDVALGDDRTPYGYRTPLATMEEEEEDSPGYFAYHPPLGPDRSRSRSRSSSTTSALLARRHPSEQQDDLLSFETRRPSLGALWSSEKTDRFPPRLSPYADYALPDAMPNMSSLLSFRNALKEPSMSTRHLVDQLENTRLRSDSSELQDHELRPQQAPLQPSHESGSHKSISPENAPRTPNDLGKGMCLRQLPESAGLYMVEFKAGRTDFFYTADTSGQLRPEVGDLVIVEADRGKDLGKIAVVSLSIEQALLHSSQNDASNATPSLSHEKQAQADIQVKRIYRLATPSEVGLLLAKGQDEQRALLICQQKVKLRELPMEVVDAEYQWDRRKLTYYFTAEKRIDFRELVRELFKIYKTRIWMCAVHQAQSKGH